MKQDIQEILFSEEVLTKRIKELASEISKDYKGKGFSCSWNIKGISNICCGVNKEYIYSL